MTRVKLVPPLVALTFAGIVAACDNAVVPPTAPAPSAVITTATPICNITDVVVPTTGLTQALQNQFAVLIDVVNEAVNTGELTCGQVNSLAVKIQAAIASAVRLNFEASCGQLDALINELQALIKTGQISPTLNVTDKLAALETVPGSVAALLAQIAGGTATEAIFQAFLAANPLIAQFLQTLGVTTLAQFEALLNAGTFQILDVVGAIKEAVCALAFRGPVL